MTQPQSHTVYLHPSEPDFYRFLSARLGTVGLVFDDVAPFWDAALSITAARFASIKNKYFHRDDRGIPLRAAHLGQNILLLYELSREAWRQSRHHVADLLYFLNTSSSGCNLLYEVDLPLRTFCDHPHGAVVGRAKFSPEVAFSFSTNCNLGNSNSQYPEIDGNFVMMPNCTILGNTTIRGNVIMSNGSKLVNAGEVRDVIVYGSPPDNTFRSLSETRYLEISNFKP